MIKKELLPVRVAICSLQSLISSFSDVQQNSFSLIIYVWPVVVSGSAFISTFEAGNHEMSGGEGYMKNLLGPEGCKNVNWISLSFTCNTQATTSSYLHVTDPLMPSIWYSSSLQVYYICGVGHSRFWEHFCLNLFFCSRTTLVDFFMWFAAVQYSKMAEGVFTAGHS